MHDKQKVTLYLPQGLHRQLKIRSAVDQESMSAMVEKAIVFYLEHPEMVDREEIPYGKTHQVYACPECNSALVNREGQLVSLKDQPNVLVEEIPQEIPVESVEVEKVRDQVKSLTDSSEKEAGKEKLVTC